MICRIGECPCFAQRAEYTDQLLPLVSTTSITYDSTFLHPSNIYMDLPKLKAPVVLVHGFLGFERIKLAGMTLANYFPGIREGIEQAGNRVLVPWLSPTNSVAFRAQQLKDFLQEHAPNEPVHLLAHSMGGLDARY